MINIRFFFEYLFLVLSLTIVGSNLDPKRMSLDKVIESKSNLELVHVVFRHGDRTPERTYPNDKYTAADYHPTGFSQLTNAGKARSFALGQILRSTYNSFLGDVYYPDIIDSLSSHAARCKTSLLAVLAGLFVPQENQMWNKELNWQPIPFHAFTRSENKIFSPFSSCPRYSAMLEEALQAVYQDENIIKYSDRFEYILTNAGMTGNVWHAIDLLYSTLKAQQHYGLALPNWTESVWPEPISEMQKHCFKYLALNDKLKSITAGYLIKRIIDNTYLTIDNDSSVIGRKIYLYAGHDVNIISLLMMMDAFDPHCPSYNAYITFEVHNIQGTRYLKIAYQTYRSTTPETIVLSCGTYCTIEQFVSLYSKYTNTTATDALCRSR